MTPAARAQAAIEILSALEATQQPLDRHLLNFFRARRYAGSGDRRVITETVFHVMRHRSRFAYRIGDAGPRSLVIAWLLEQGQQPEATFTGGDYAPAPLSIAEREAIAHRPNREPPAHILGEYPHFLEAELQRRFGDKLVDEMAALSERAPVDLRVNTLKAKRDEVLSILRGEGFEAEQTPFALSGVRIAPGKGSASLQRSRLFQSGGFEFQDEAAQIAALLCNPKPGQDILDLAAGAGGKSLALAALMQNEGRIIASDVRQGSLDQLRERAGRAGAAIVLPRLSDKLRNETFETVLLDSPCSGTGTWRRQPELRWRLTPERLDELNRLQDKLLDQAARHTRRDGCLVYATCSILPRENEDRVAAFLVRNSGFTIVPAAAVWRESGAPLTPPGMADVFDASPHSSGTDGFFVAILRRE